MSVPRERMNELHREYMRKRYLENAAYREKLIAANRALPTVVKQARDKVRRALERGELVRSPWCAACHNAAFCEAAHKDYSQPLKVRWLCRSCHRKWDQADPKIKRA